MFILEKHNNKHSPPLHKAYILLEKNINKYDKSNNDILNISIIKYLQKLKAANRVDKVMGEKKTNHSLDRMIRNNLS